MYYTCLYKFGYAAYALLKKLEGVISYEKYNIRKFEIYEEGDYILTLLSNGG